MSYIECLVLGLVNEGYSYGYQLDKVMQERNMRYWAKVSRKSIYLTLQKLEAKGYVSAKTQQLTDMPPQIVYTITSAGEKHLKDLIAEGLAAQKPVTFDINIPIAFLSELPPEQAAAQLKKRQEWVQQLHKNMPSEAETDSFGKKTNMRLLRRYYQMEKEWLDEIIDELSEK